MKLLGLALLLFSCWHFSASEEPPAEQRAPSRPRRAVVAPADAAVADAELAAADLDAGVAGVADAAVATRTFPPATVPPCVRGRVIATSLTGSRLVLTVDVGSDAGVTKLWTARYFAAPQTSVQVIRVDRKVTIISVSGLTPDQIQRNPVVLLCP